MKKMLMKLIFCLIPGSLLADAVFIRCPSPGTLQTESRDWSGHNYTTWTQNGEKIVQGLFTDKDSSGKDYLVAGSVGLLGAEKKGDLFLCKYQITMSESGKQQLIMGDNTLFAKDSELAKYFLSDNCYVLNPPDYPIGLLCVNDIQIASEGDREGAASFSMNQYEKDYYRELLRQVDVID